MKRSVLKWIFGLSVAALVLFWVFIVAIWLMAGVAGALLNILVFNGAGNMVSLGQFLSNFVGSPMFYILVVILIALLGSGIGLLTVKK